MKASFSSSLYSLIGEYFSERTSADFLFALKLVTFLPLSLVSDTLLSSKFCE